MFLKYGVLSGVVAVVVFIILPITINYMISIPSKISMQNLPVCQVEELVIAQKVAYQGKEKTVTKIKVWSWGEVEIILN